VLLAIAAVGSNVTYGVGSALATKEPYLGFALRGIGMVFIRTGFGGTRVVDMLIGDPLPRIC
jgi:hydrogenase expression/formation protein HypE